LSGFFFVALKPVSLNLTKSLPPLPIGAKYEEGSPQDLQNLTTLIREAAQQRAGITCVGKKKSSPSLPAQSAAFADWIDQANSSNSFFDQQFEGFSTMLLTIKAQHLIATFPHT